MKAIVLTLFSLLALFGGASSAYTAEIRVSAGEDKLARAIELAQEGDRLLLAAGRHFGPLRIEKPLMLIGQGRAIVDAKGSGSVILIDAQGVTVENLEIVGSGNSHEEIDSGVSLTAKATGALIHNNVLTGNLYGVDIHGARDARITGNVITGRQDRHMNRRGNGVYVWNAPGAVVEGNTIRFGRDGIFVNTSRANEFRGNRFSNLRFAVHYMYANDSVVSGNISVGNDLGYAIMFADRVVIKDNISIRDRDHGIMLNYANNSVIEGNAVIAGGEKCLFVYNANKNVIRGNRLESCPIGIHYTGGSSRNEITGNAFVGNGNQVKLVSTRNHIWSGNYWSDHAAYDVNGDGIADQPFRPNDTMDRILWTQPAARLLVGSPAIQMIRWAQRKFPALLPGGVVDDKPLMKPRELPRFARKWKASVQ
jgi:nitrous oxidase accessory protein